MSDILDFGGNLPPQDIEAEEAVLGGILLIPEVMETVAKILDPEAFYLDAHKYIYTAAIRLHSAHKPTNLLNITESLSKNGMLARIGGNAKLAKLIDRTISAASIHDFAEVVQQKYLSRRLISSGNEIVQLGYDESKPLVERLNAAEEKIFSIRHQNQIVPEPEFAGNLSSKSLEKIKQFNQGIDMPAYPTGFYELDSMIHGGLKRGSLIVVGSRPSIGKSAFARQIAFVISACYKLPTIVFSLGMSKEDINMRLLAFESCIQAGLLNTGRVSQTQWVPLERSIRIISELPLLIDDSPCLTPLEIRSKIRKVIAKHGSLGLVVIDDLQLMVDGSDNRLPQPIGQIIKQLKSLAKEYNIPIVLLSQLNPNLESRTNKRPMLSDLPDTYSMERDVDLVLGLYRDEYYNPDTPDIGIAEVSILKNRNGFIGRIKLEFKADWNRFDNLKY
ncbi:replicative DNA helicase [Nostoc sp. FACHB-892]|uniref:replicative DNA helicase n=1 Tax=Nostoc sp. FACHB-892 TaxID=2692843 RepID=UPI001682911F|nr:replicative DNA helicase [Nostoc sp. FACHB-892]MBD2730945.1 replicative DNA helicase [Nostoc sp. FACHB-892]